MSQSKNMTGLYTLYFNIQHHLLHDTAPSDYLEKIYNMPLFQQYPFQMLYRLKATLQSKKYHPEGNVWKHTLLVVNEAAKIKTKSKNQRIFMWAALLHDIGKPAATKKRKDRITSYNHDKIGAELSKEFLSFFTDDMNFVYTVSALVKYHMQILFVVNDLSFADIYSMKQDTDIYEVALLGLCDRIGRLNSDKSKEQQNIKEFIKRCEMYDSSLK